MTRDPSALAVPPSPPPTLRSALGALMDAMRAPREDPATLPDDGHQPHFLDAVAPILDMLYRAYFRVDLHGIDHVPASGPALLVANHSGGIPYDGAMLIHGIRREHPARRTLRTLVANFAFQVPWMTHVVARIGGVRASTDNAMRLLNRGELLGVFPEGLKGVGKHFRDRYRLSHFGRGGFVRLARRARVPVIPVAIVGAEEIHPLLGKLTTLAQPLGIPYIPITPTFPWLGPLGLLPVPTKWTIHIGEPLMLPAEGDESQGSTMEMAARIRGRIDDMIAERLSRRHSILFG